MYEAEENLKLAEHPPLRQPTEPSRPAVAERPIQPKSHLSGFGGAATPLGRY
jgi:hypothetical protein